MSECGPECALGEAFRAMAPAPSDRAAAALRRLGRGVNIFWAALPRLTSEDWHGLASRGVGHVRLCASLVDPLIEWSTCPATTRSLREEEAVAALRRTRAMAELKAAAHAARRAGLSAVLNPMHRLHTLQVRADTLRWVWSAMLLEFDEGAFPSDGLVFELVNEPGNYHNHTVVGSRWVDMLPDVLELIARAQPKRVVIVGAEMGRRTDQPSAAAAGFVRTRADLYSSAVATAAASSRAIDFVNSGPALAMDAASIADLGKRFALIATFHFYRPRNFTSQGLPDVVHPQPRWKASAADLADLATQFDEARRALGPAIPVYLGEFGVNVDLIPHPEDGVSWLRHVRAICDARGFGWAVWTYYLTVKGARISTSAREHAHHVQ